MSDSDDWADIFRKIEWEGGLETTFLDYGLEVKDPVVQGKIKNFSDARDELIEVLNVRGWADWQEENEV